MCAQTWLDGPLGQRLHNVVLFALRPATRLPAVLLQVVLLVGLVSQALAAAANETSQPLDLPVGWPSLGDRLGTPSWMKLDFNLTAEPLGGSLSTGGTSAVWMQQLSLNATFSPGLAKPRDHWRELDHWSAQLQLTTFSGNPDLNLALGTTFPLQTGAHPTGVWLTEASVQRITAGDPVFFKAGILSLNPSFVQSAVFNNYINSTLNNTLNLTITGLPINPFVAPGALMHVRLSPSSELRLGQFWLNSETQLAALLGVNPGQPRVNGTLQLVQWTMLDLPGSRAVSSPIRQGERLISRQLPAPELHMGGFNSTASLPGPNQGVYGSFSLPLQLPAGLDHRLWLGFSAGFNPVNNPTPLVLSGGWLSQGLLPGRPFDVLAFGISSSQLSQTLSSNLSNEHVLELNYTIPINSMLSVQPVLQWIVNPGGNPSRAAVIAGGVQLSISF